MYGVICDRVGASLFTEDLTGASFHSICHPDEHGDYSDRVDASVLPKPSGGAALSARQSAVAKMERLATHRASLIRAFNAAFPDIDIPNVTTADSTDTIGLHDAVLAFSHDVTALYEHNPTEPGAAPLMPEVTRALGRMFGGLENDPEALAAMTRIAGRPGYRPFQVVLAAVRLALAYPELRPMVRSLVEVVGPGRHGEPQLQQLLAVAKYALATAEDNVSSQPLLTVDAATAQPNRPREIVEVLQAIMLDQHESYADQSAGEERFIAARDSRGVVIPFDPSGQHVPGKVGTVPPPFADVDMDGFADVVAGVFVDGAGLPLSVDTPFNIPGVAALGTVDAWGRPETAPGQTLYQYVDTTRSFTGALARNLIGLVDPSKYAADEDPEPWEVEHEGLMYALAGMRVLAGPREPAEYDFDADRRLEPGESCSAARCLPYTRFRAEDSPIPDLIHALGQVLADPDSDALLQGLIKLGERAFDPDKEDVVARLVAAALRVKAIADEHDELADQGLEPKAELPYENPIWDQVAEIVSQIADEPGLVARILCRLSDDSIVTTYWQDPVIGSESKQHLGETLADFMTYRDQYRYDVYDINGHSINITDGYPSIADPHNPVNRTAPLRGENRSMFERTVQLMYDSMRVKTCNKDGARVYLGAIVPDVYWPLFGDYDQCELFRFDNMGAFYLGTALPLNHPKRAELVIRASDLSGLLDFIDDYITNTDLLMEESSGIEGLTFFPTSAAVNRLDWFGAYSEQFGYMPEYDSYNANSHTAKFVNATIEPVCGPVCPAQGPQNVPVCSDVDDTLRIRDFGTIFGWERLNFLPYQRPIFEAFAETACYFDDPYQCPYDPFELECNPDDYTGENYFGDIIRILWSHWPGPDHGDYCDGSGGSLEADPRYCSGAGLNRYEPLIAEALREDLIPALHAFAKAVIDPEMNVTIARGPRAGEVMTGPEVVEKLTRILFSQSYAASVGMVDRRGQSATTWTDGTPQAQVTVYTLFADALHRMDQRFAERCSCEGLEGQELTDCQEQQPACEADAAARQGMWKRARSELVDTFLASEGQGSATRFAERSIPRMLVSALGVLREQLNANCPEREAGQPCIWAKSEMGTKLSDVLSGPLFAAIDDLNDALRSDEGARRQLERFLSYALMSQSANDALQTLLAALSDLVQLLSADGDFMPIFRAVHNVANPADDADGPGAVDRVLPLLDAVSSDRYDRYHVLDYVLPALVTPMDDGQGLTPVEVIMNAIADVERADASDEAVHTPLGAEDYRLVFKSVREFLTDPSRGFEQLYYIVQHRQR